MLAEIYINGMGNVSPQETIENSLFPGNIVSSNTYLKSILPSVKNFIDPAQSRRMGHVLKMGLVAAKLCLRDAEVTMPGAIITGTGLGCIEDSEKFSDHILTSDEGLLPPTSFIQSTHNSISAFIALSLKCHAYNNTFVHRGFSFESAVTDAIMLLKEGSAEEVLVGGIDELTANSHTIMKRMGHFKKEQSSNLDLLKSKSKGTMVGEGACFFMFSNKINSHSYAQIKAMTIVYKPESQEELYSRLDFFLKTSSIDVSDIDLVIAGFNGSIDTDAMYEAVIARYFGRTNLAWFKHLCGEYHTASAFGLWLAAMIIRFQTIPPVCLINQLSDKPIRNILIYNHYLGINHAFYLVSICQDIK